ncbi:hypothetical protein AVEN_4533-1 [Araneus ventricosus]|uniref:Uncharacterized protein n=1 Tax=Araneus ventricosus TaxID=182803 RepID=A0A4Y2BN29_ARAVE|nr:hypothetical protein AVEN_4533-1 [Araneus ventricosus]
MAEVFLVYIEARDRCPPVSPESHEEGNLSSFHSVTFRDADIDSYPIVIYIDIGLTLTTSSSSRWRRFGRSQVR